MHDYWENHPWDKKGIESFKERKNEMHERMKCEKRYDSEIKSAKEKLRNAIEQINIWIRGELEILRDLLTNKGEG